MWRILNGFLWLCIVNIFLVNNLNSQQIQPFTIEQQDKVDEYHELFNYYKNQGNIKQAVFYLNRIAFMYWETGNVRQAIDYFLQSVPLNEEIGNLNDIKVIYSNIGLIYTDMEELETALQYFIKSLEVRRRIGIQEEIASGLIDVAYLTGILRDYENANELLEEALEISLDEGNARLILSCYNLLSQNYNALGDLKKSEEFSDKYESYQNYIAEQDIKVEYEERETENLIEIEKTKAEKRAKEMEFALKQLQFQVTQDSMSGLVQAKADSLQEAERISRIRQQEIRLLQQEQELQKARIAENEARQKVSRLIIYSVSIGFVLVIFVAYFAYRGFKLQRKTNVELEAKNIEIENKSQELASANLNITKSINYAQGIQRALLPRQELLNTYLPESFILFKPRDIVSGDFYWFTEIDSSIDLFETKKESIVRRDGGSFEDFEFLPIENNKFAIAAVDCTGHGVPGAFMSMIGYNLLDEITGKGVTRADVILNDLHKGVRRTLKQDITENRDGMDMALCVINKIERTVEYAGAENPLIYIQNGKVDQIKGDRNPIGGLQTEKKRAFTSHTIKVNKPSWFYILSDGFIDQFGGLKGRKFLISNLRDLLFEIHEKPMMEQKEILDKAFNDWIGEEHKQIDDILIIGFKLG